MYKLFLNTHKHAKITGIVFQLIETIKKIKIKNKHNNVLQR